MHKVAEKGVRRGARQRRVTVSYEMLLCFFSEILVLPSGFCRVFLFRVRSDAPSYRFKVPGGHSARRADEKYKKARATEKKMTKTKKVEMRTRLNFVVFFAGATVRSLSRKRKSISSRETEQREKKKRCANPKKGTKCSQTKTKLHNVPGNDFCARRARHR